jgi:hypothetical protein
MQKSEFFRLSESIETREPDAEIPDRSEVSRMTMTVRSVTRIDIDNNKYALTMNK